MIIKHRGIEPQVDSSVYIAPTATVVGNVSIAPETKVMFGAVINSEGSRISIDRNTIVSENAVIRAHGGWGRQGEYRMSPIKSTITPSLMAVFCWGEERAAAL